MKRIFSIFLLLTVMLSASAGISKLEVLELGDNLLTPVFSDDGENLLYVSMGSGYVFNMNTEKKTKFSDAAYDFTMDKSGNIRYRTDTFIDKKKVNSVKMFNVNTEKTEILLDKKRLDIVPTIKDHGVYYVEKNAVKGSHTLSKSVSQPVVMSYDNGLLLYSYGTSKVLRPSGDAMYLWPSVSPDNSMIAYTDINDLVVSDMNGSILFTVREARAPKWSPDGNYIVFMRDLDDGHSFTASELYLVDVSDQEVIQLTDTEDRMEMNPSWSPDGRRIVCEDAQNDVILILTLDK